VPGVAEPPEGLFPEEPAPGPGVAGAFELSVPARSRSGSSMAPGSAGPVTGGGVFEFEAEGVEFIGAASRAGPGSISEGSTVVVVDGLDGTTAPPQLPDGQGLAGET
jgi:hypothetical protein